MRHVILIAAAIMATSPAWADDKKTARTIGYAIGCGCTRTDIDTMIKYLKVFFSDASEAELRSLAGYVKSGEQKIRMHGGAPSFCGSVCYQLGDTFKEVDDFIEGME